jgi:hypothetical protein
MESRLLRAGIYPEWYAGYISVSDTHDKSPNQTDADDPQVDELLNAMNIVSA